MNFTLKDFPATALKGACIQGITRRPANQTSPGGFSVCLPWPPTLGKLWRSNRDGTWRCDKAYKAYKESAAASALAQGARPFSGPIDVTLHLYFPKSNRRSDTDSRCKAILDSMNGILYADDSQVRDLVIRRWDEAKEPRVMLLVQPGAEWRTA